MARWQPDEVIVDERVRDDPVTERVLAACRGAKVKHIDGALAEEVKEASDNLSEAEGMLRAILAGKRVLFVAAPGDKVVDVFEMPDSRILCPHFDRLKLASNGCCYRCEWCYLKLTYRSVRPFITVHAGYDTIKRKLRNRLKKARGHKVMFNSGELADSLALEHLTGAAQEFIPWFGQQPTGYLFMLTKSDNVAPLLKLEHNGHTIVAWSMNAPEVSKLFELGAPSFDRRLRAACKVQAAGYPVRVRLDPIVPVPNWQEQYAETIERIFKVLEPDRITLGTLRFEPAFWNARNEYVTKGSALLEYMQLLEPMFPKKLMPGKKQPVAGKYSFLEDERAELFEFAIREIRRHKKRCTIALCKESADVWQQVGLNPARCRCVCQLDYADMS